VFLALLIQHAMRMHRITLSSVACLVYSTYVHTVLQSVQFFVNLLNTKCVF